MEEYNCNANIVLTGFMGTGKTTVGRIVAQRLQREFVDMDAMIEERTGRTISDVFAVDGEEHFRSIESRLARELADKESLVVGTGGGIVLDPDNIRAFSRTGIVVCLNACPETILKRVETEDHRPLLETGEKAERILSVLRERKELYAQVPYQIDTDNLTCEEVANAVLRIFRKN